MKKPLFFSKMFGFIISVVTLEVLLLSSISAMSSKIIPLSAKEKSEMVEKKTWSPDCPVKLDQLAKIQFSYVDFEGKVHEDGEIVVFAPTALRVAKILDTLFEKRFPISKARRIEHYNGDDEQSMADNNSSCFNCRTITGGADISIHSYGLALDFNPIQNPYISSKKAGGIVEVHPAAGIDYLNRTNRRPGMAEEIADIFKENGFYIWGGNWNSPIDWQHFQPSRVVAQILAVMAPSDATEFFEMYVREAKLLNSLPVADNKLPKYYTQDAEKFMTIFRQNPQLLAEQTDQFIKDFEAIWSRV